MDDEARRRFREVVAECTPAMMAVSYLITGSQEAAEQALRRALAVTARRWHRVEDAPESHILKALCRYELSWRRRLRRGGPADDDPGSAHPGLRTAMQRALQALPVGDRLVLTLRHHEMLTPDETAEVLGRSPEWVDARTRDARIRLRELLAEQSTADGAVYRTLDPGDATGRRRREPDF